MARSTAFGGFMGPGKTYEVSPGFMPQNQRIDLQENLPCRGVSCAIYLSAGSEANGTDSSYF